MNNDLEFNRINKGLEITRINNDHEMNWMNNGFEINRTNNGHEINKMNSGLDMNRTNMVFHWEKETDHGDTFIRVISLSIFWIWDKIQITRLERSKFTRLLLLKWIVDELMNILRDNSTSYTGLLMSDNWLVSKFTVLERNVVGK